MNRGREKGKQMRRQEVEKERGSSREKIKEKKREEEERGAREEREDVGERQAGRGGERKGRSRLGCWRQAFTLMFCTCPRQTLRCGHRSTSDSGWSGPSRSTA